jgi:cytochrome c peroxidase
VSRGCVTCHNGPVIGGNSYRMLGQVIAYETKDVGREGITKLPEDRHAFKVPSLRNVAKTGPWFHDGSVASLDDAIRLMAKHQLGKTLSDAEVASIRAFLDSLTGEVDANYTAPPTLPESGPDTPGPDLT